MSSIIDVDDEIWKMFLGYSTLIGAQAKEEGLDLFGADQKTILAKDLVLAHMLDHVSCTLKDIKEQQAMFERTKYHIKPDVTAHTHEQLNEERGKADA